MYDIDAVKLPRTSVSTYQNAYPYVSEEIWENRFNWGQETDESEAEICKNPAVITKVKDMFAETPQMSVRKLANSTTENASSTSVYRMLRFDLKLTPYTISIMQHLKPSDIDYRIHFGRWMIEHDIIEHVWFSGEAHFYLNGDVNNGYAFW